MSTTTTRDVMDQYVQALLEGGDFARFFAPDVVWTTMETGEQIRGRDSVEDAILYFHVRAFQAQPELVRLLVDERSAMVEAVFDATHTGDFFGIAPTGAHVRLPYVVSYDVEDGAITALRAYLPMGVLREQLTSAVPAQTAPV
jgi:predicted ester cyclase